MGGPEAGTKLYWSDCMNCIKLCSQFFLGEIHNQSDNCFFFKLAKLGQFVPPKNPLFMLQLTRLFAF
jgi:hypothetical protein